MLVQWSLITSSILLAYYVGEMVLGNTFLLIVESLKGRLLRKLATMLLGNEDRLGIPGAVSGVRWWPIRGTLPSGLNINPDAPVQ